jgi:hypothetical protein
VVVVELLLELEEELLEEELLELEDVVLEYPRLLELLEEELLLEKRTSKCVVDVLVTKAAESLTVNRV